MPRPSQIIALCVLGLLSIGVVMVSSAGMSVTDTTAVTFESIVLSRSTAYMVLALVAMIVAARLRTVELLDARRLGPADRPAAVHPFFVGALVLLAVWLLLVYIPGFGRTVNGSSRWIHVPVAGSLQPSELAKWGAVILLAMYCAWQGPQRMARFSRLLPALVLIGVPAALVTLEDLGTGVLMLAAASVILLASGARFFHLAAFAPPAALGLVVAVITSPYRMQRLVTFLNPYADPEGAGYHMIQSMVAVANGQVFGRGLGFGLQKFGYLPEDRTDFLFAVICEELGVFGAATIMALYLGILWGGWSIIRRLPESAAAARLLGIGVLATVGLQAVINIGVVTGLGPTKGIALPLLSSGGTGWILTAFSLGLLISLDREEVHWSGRPTVRSERIGAFAAPPITVPTTSTVQAETREPVTV